MATILEILCLRDSTMRPSPCTTGSVCYSTIVGGAKSTRNRGSVLSVPMPTLGLGTLAMTLSTMTPSITGISSGYTKRIGVSAKCSVKRMPKKSSSPSRPG